MYATALVGLRLGERRTLAQWSIIDFVTAVRIGAIVGRTAIAGSSSEERLRLRQTGRLVESLAGYRHSEGTLMTDHLLRKYAPIPTTGWQQIDEEAKNSLTPKLAARRLVDWSGPHGWAHSATNLGRTAALEAPPPGTKSETVIARQRRVLPLSEFRVSFTVECSGLQDAERGATDVDYGDLDRAAHDAALIENRAVFHGWPEAGIIGIVESSSHSPLPLSGEVENYPHAIAEATNVLRQAGIEGPYALAIGPEGYTRVVETIEHGYSLEEHLHKILGGDIVWAPGLDGAVVMSKRGGDFILDIGQDFSIGYVRHDAELVTLYLEESFSFRVTEPEAAVALTLYG